MEDAERKSPILAQLEKNTQFLINLRDSVAKLKTRLDIVLLSSPAQNEESKGESKDESKVLRSLMVQSGIICSINDNIQEVTTRLEV